MFPIVCYGLPKVRWFILNDMLAVADYAVTHPVAVSFQERLCVFCVKSIMAVKKITTRRTGKSGTTAEAKTGKGKGVVELVLEEESDDDLPGLGPKEDSDEEEDGVGETAGVAVAKAADCTRKFFSVSFSLHPT
jgi:hypothetical protein